MATTRGRKATSASEVRSTPQNPNRKKLPDGFDWDYGIVTVWMLAALTPDEVAVYVVVDARCKGYTNKFLTTAQICAYLPNMSDKRVRDAIHGLHNKGYIDVSRGSIGGTFRCTVIFNPQRNIEHLMPVALVDQAPPAPRYRRQSTTEFDDEGAPIHDPQPQCPAFTKNGQGPRCRAHVKAGTEYCIAHQSLAICAVESVDPCAAESVAVELPESPHGQVHSAVDSDAQVLVLEAAGREAVSTADRTAPRLCIEGGLGVVEGGDTDGAGANPGATPGRVTTTTIGPVRGRHHVRALAAGLGLSDNNLYTAIDYILNPHVCTESIDGLTLSELTRVLAELPVIAATIVLDPAPIERVAA